MNIEEKKRHFCMHDTWNTLPLRYTPKTREEHKSDRGTNFGEPWKHLRLYFLFIIFIQNGGNLFR